jgi:hypothetical protein
MQYSTVRSKRVPPEKPSLILLPIFPGKRLDAAGGL